LMVHNSHPFYCHRDLRVLHSFPTRRSSDLGLLVVRASSADQQNVADFLDKAQRNLQRQVILETKILEVSLTNEFQAGIRWTDLRSEEHTSELQSRENLVCRLLLEKKKSVKL